MTLLEDYCYCDYEWCDCSVEIDIEDYWVTMILTKSIRYYCGIVEKAGRMTWPLTDDEGDDDDDDLVMILLLVTGEIIIDASDWVFPVFYCWRKLTNYIVVIPVGFGDGTTLMTGMVNYWWCWNGGDIVMIVDWWFTVLWWFWRKVRTLLIVVGWWPVITCIPLWLPHYYVGVMMIVGTFRWCGWWWLPCCWKVIVGDDSDLCLRKGLRWWWFWLWWWWWRYGRAITLCYWCSLCDGVDGTLK